MDRNRNVIINLGEGETLGIRISNWVLIQCQKKCNATGVIDLFNKIGMDDGNLNVEAFTILLMESIDEYNHYENTGKPLCSAREASEYIDKMGGVINALREISIGLVAHIPKNLTPPQMEGEPILQ